MNPCWYEAQQRAGHVAPGQAEARNKFQSPKFEWSKQAENKDAIRA